MKNFVKYLIFLFLIPACSAPKTATTTKPATVNLSKAYNPVSSKFHPSYVVFHNSPISSILMIKIFPVELLYSGTIEPNKLIGKVQVKFTLMDITDPVKPQLADSGSTVYSFNRDEAQKRFISRLLLKTEDGKFYQLMVDAKDMVRNDENITYLMVDKTSPLSEQNFLVTEAGQNTPVFEPYVVGNNLFTLEYDRANYDSIYVYFYGGEIPLPKPSFSLIREREFLGKPDSLWILPFTNHSTYQLNYHGVYHFEFDTTKHEGITLFNFGDSYPKVQEVKQLVDALAYLTTSFEYDALEKAGNMKLALDNFWLDKAGNIDKAREMIKVYYNRVFYANYFFTSFKPGWKTDRGMIFIIYGPPQAVKTLPNQEKWIYYKNNFTTTVTFTFNYVDSPFTLNNYILERSENYDTYWRQAVDSWRSGKIYMIE